MNEKVLISLVHLYLLKKNKLNREIISTRAEYQRLHKKLRHILAVRNKLILFLSLLIDSSFVINRRFIWSHGRCDKWWTDIVPTMNDKMFKDNFRLQRSTFIELVNKLHPYLTRNDTHLRRAVPVHKRVACALYLLGSTCELRTASNLFGIGCSTAAQILHDFCSILVKYFFNRLIKFPMTNEEIRETTNDFLINHGYPMCIGCVDGSHISIKPPFGQECDYFNYKKFHSTILLAVVNASLQFTYVNIGAPGRCNDSSVYTRSTLSKVMENPIYSNYYITVNNVKIQAHLIADSAFPLSSTLIKPYSDRPNMPRSNSLFNYRLSHCRSTVERAFGCLKNRFRCLHKKMEYSLDHVKTIIKAAVILHNICIVSGDGFDIDWDASIPTYKKLICNSQTTAGIGIREALTDFFMQNPL